MRFAPLQTVRAKLIATTMALIAVVLLVLGTVSDVVARQAILGSIDRDLQLRASDLANQLAREDRPGAGPFGGGFGRFPPRGPGFGQGAPPQGPPEGRPMRRNLQLIAPTVIPVAPDFRPGPGGPGQSEPLDPASFERAKAGEDAYSTAQVEGETRRVYSVPVRRQGSVVAVVQAAYPIGDVLDTLDSLRRILLTVILPAGLALAAALGFFLVGGLLRPLRKITQDTERIGAGNLDERLQVRGRDEFASLAGTLNRMLERIHGAFLMEKQTTAKLEQTVEQQRRFTADASHELKTPLAVVKAHAGLLRHAKEIQGENLESANAIDDAADRMTALVQDLLVLARTDAGRLSGEKSPLDLAKVLERARQSVPGGNTAILNAEESVLVAGSEPDLLRVFVNLLDNALQHGRGDMPPEMRLAREDDWAIVSVEDRGPGISAEHLPHLFERFYRPDSSRSSTTGGTGLGLAICKAIVEAHGGNIATASEVGVGTRVEVKLPLAEES